MSTDFDNLIRHSRPAVPPTARERVLDYVQAGGAAASAPAPFRMLARVAAMVLLALGAGIVSALATQRSEPVDTIVDFNAQVDGLRARVESAEAEAAKLEQMDAQLAALETERQGVLHDMVVGLANARDQRRMEEWRARHIEHVRELNRRAADETIERLRGEASLTADQEAEVRALLDEAGKEAEALIARFYGRGRHHSAHREFEKLAEATDEKLNALLSEQQRRQVGEGLVSSRPEDWGPSSEFRDGTDYEVYMNWMSVSRD